MLKMEHFFYVIEVSKTGSINKAAENLYVSQPYLSSVLKELEGELGVTLFKRTHKGVTLTEAGEKFLKYSTEIEAVVTKVKNLKDSKDNLEEKLAISSIYSFTIMDIYHNFSKNPSHKTAHISYEETQNKYIPDKVASGKADVGIIFLDSINEKLYKEDMLKEGLTFVALSSEPLHIIVSLNHPLAESDSVSMKDLEPYSLIIEEYKKSPKGHLKDSSTYIDLFKNINIDSVHFDNNRSLMYYLTKSKVNFSVGMNCLNLSNPFVKAGELKYIPIKDLNIYLTVGVIYKRNLPMTDIKESFIKYLKATWQRDLTF